MLELASLLVGWTVDVGAAAAGSDEERVRGHWEDGDGGAISWFVRPHPMDEERGGPRPGHFEPSDQQPNLVHFAIRGNEMNDSVPYYYMIDPFMYPGGRRHIWHAFHLYVSCRCSDRELQQKSATSPSEFVPLGTQTTHWNSSPK
ncbi:hypothetical protein ACLOJK_014458 [Asimina triloba]